MRPLKIILGVMIIFITISSLSISIDAGGKDWRDKLGPGVKEKTEKNRGFSFRALMNQKKDRINVIVRGKNRSELDKYGKIKDNFWIIPAASMKVPINNIEGLAKNPDVESINLDYKVHTLRLQSVPMIRADVARENYDLNGTDVNISIVDTGIYNHTEFQTPNRIIDEKCFCSLNGGCCPGGGNISNNATDDFGHGTHCAGIAAGEGGQRKGSGVARDASLFAVKVLDSAGDGYSTDIIKGIQWSVNHSANIISLSVGGNYNCYDTNPSVADAVDNAIELGSLVVVAAGNNGTNQTITSPACAKRALAVGSVSDTGLTNPDEISDFSSRGPTSDNRTKPDLMAPGAYINSTYLNNQYEPKPGTSMATPHISGVAALLYEKYKEINGKFPDPDLAKAILLTSVNTTGMNQDGFYQRNNWYGSGRIDAEKAIKIMNSTKHGNITENKTHEYRLNVTSKGFITTLYWPDSSTINNNLNLVVGNSTKNFTYHTDRNDSIEQRFMYNISPGIWNVYVKGKIVSGEQNYYLASDQQIFEDLIPPSLSLYKPESMTYPRQNQIPLNFSTDPTNNTIWYTLNGTNKTVITDNTTFNVSSDGTYNFTLYVNDSYDNVNSTHITFSIDSTPPSIFIQSPTENEINNTVWFNISSNEPINTSFLSINSGPNSTMNGTNTTYFYNSTELEEGSYNVTFYLNDSVGWWNSTSKDFNISIDPIINSPSVSRSPILPNVTVNITTNITEENFDRVWFNLSSPFNITKNLTNSTKKQYPGETSWYLSFNETNSTGIYNFIVSINDLMGNHVNISDLFKVSQPVTFQINSSDGNNQSKNLTWNIYDGTGNLRKNKTTNSTNITLPKGIWDFRIIGNSSVDIEDVNISENISKNIFWDGNSSLENITNTSYIFHKVSSFYFNLTFDKAGISIPFNSSIIDNNKAVFRCDNWNFSRSKCESGWKNISENSLIGSNYTDINSTNLSSFALVEYCEKFCGGWSSCGDGTKTRTCYYSNCSTYEKTKKCETNGGGGGTITGGGFFTPPEPECTSNSNCSEYQKCSDEECVNITCECGYMENHSCLSYDCCSDDQCFDNQTCENHTCELKFNLTLRKNVESSIDSLKEELENKSREGYNVSSLLKEMEKAKGEMENGNYSTSHRILENISNEIDNLSRNVEGKNSVERNHRIFIFPVLLIILIVEALVIFKYAH